MLCPVCNVELQMTDRQGVEIDYCPKCRGVWLDRGELDKIIERSAENEQRLRSASAPATAVRRDTAPEFYPDYEDDYDDDYKRKNDTRYAESDPRYGDRRHDQRRKRSFLDDVFDIFD
jgi:Zn-finger nucleic acid-binding protein